MKATWLLIVATLLLASCTTFKDSSSTDRLYLEKQNLHALEGVYASTELTPPTYSDGTPKGILFSGDFLNKLYSYNTVKAVSNAPSNYSFRVAVVDENKLAVSLLKDSIVVKSKTIRGKLKNGYFYRRKALLVMPFVGVLYGYTAHRQRIGIENETLIVDLRDNVYMGFLTAGHVVNEQRKTRYRKL